jgi:hypothetical protein
MSECNCREDVEALTKKVESLERVVVGTVEPIETPGLSRRVAALEADKKNIASLLKWLLLAIGGLGVAFVQQFLPTPPKG